MRILLATMSSNNRWSGMGKWSHEIADALRAMGHEPTLWFADDFPRPSRVKHAFDVVFLKPIALAKQLSRCATQFDVAVIHEPSGFWYGLARQLRPDLPPLVVMCHNVESKNFHDLSAAADRGLGSISAGRRLRTRLLRHSQSNGAIRFADAVVCLSSTDRDYIVSRLHRAPKDVFVMINGASPEHFVGDPETRHGRRVLFVGGWLQVKGRDLLPLIWAKIRDRCPDATLTLVGTHTPAPEVLAAFDPAVRDSITVIPKVESRDMAGYFDRHDLFLMTSLSEGSPLSLLEAMAAGLPVVASAVGGICDIIENGVNGILFPALDCESAAKSVVQLFDDRSVMLSLARAARERAQHLTWRAAAETLVAAIDRATKTSHVPRHPADFPHSLRQGTTRS
jgi:glycosyltransferase involved in cell wall biosynthesis